MTYEFDKYPEDRTEKDLETHVAPAVRYHMKNFLAAIDSRGHPVSDIEQGYISTASCILANNCHETGQDARMGPAKAQRDWRSGGQRPVAPSLIASLGNGRMQFPDAVSAAAVIQ